MLARIPDFSLHKNKWAVTLFTIAFYPTYPMALVSVGVLMGGKSIEREVSFNSGRTVCDHLDRARYKIVPVFQALTGELYILPAKFLHRGKISDFEHRLAHEAQSITWDMLPSLIDFAYLTMHGRYGEDGCLQGILEMLGIPYLGSKLFASAVGMDKSIQKDFLRMAGIAVPHGITLTPSTITRIIHDHEALQALLIHHELPLPVVIKPVHEGSSLGVSIVQTVHELGTALIHAMNITPGIKQSVIVEEKIEGMEFSCIVITDVQTQKPIPLMPTEIETEKEKRLFDYDQKYMPGRAMKYTPPRCASDIIEKIQEVSVRTMQALSMDTIARIDGFVTSDKRVIITDPNTLAGMAPSSFVFVQAAEKNMSHADFINHLIESELVRYKIIEAARI